MRYKILAVMTLVSTLVCSHAGAVEYTSEYLESGRGLLEDCEDAGSNFNSGYCLGFIHGMCSMHDYAARKYSARLYCAPDEVTNGQVRRIIIKFLKDHPNRLHETDLILAVDALREAFPCKK